MTKPQKDTESQTRLRGYNHNFNYRGTVFHIQTENYGYPRCYICSHVFIAGQVVKRIKTEYCRTTDELQSLAHLKGLMLAAHRQMFQLLKSGAFDEYIEQESKKPDPALAHPHNPTFANSDIEKLDKQLKTAADAFKDAPPVSRPPDVPLPAANGPAPALKAVPTSNAIKLKPLASTPTKKIVPLPKSDALPPRASAKPSPIPAFASAPALSPASQASLAEFTKATSGLITLALFDASDEDGQLQFASGPSPKVSPPVLKDLVKLRQGDHNPKDPTDHMVELVTNAEHHLMLLCRVNERSSLFLLIDRSGGNLALVHHRVSKLISKLHKDLIKA